MVYGTYNYSIHGVYKPSYKWFYGRYNYSIHRGYFMVYKPTNITGGGHPEGTPPKKKGHVRKDQKIWLVDQFK